jgi:hypothetical protein
MKRLLGLAAVFSLWAATAMAGDGRISSQSLAKVGLSGMTAISDAQGLEIRGLGVSEATSYGKEGENGKDHHKNGEKNECHERKQHENCGHQHENCGHSSCGSSCCNFSSLCHIQSSGHKL